MAIRKQDIQISVDCVCLAGETSNINDVDSEDCRCSDCQQARIEACMETFGAENKRGAENRQKKQENSKKRRVQFNQSTKYQKEKQNYGDISKLRSSKTRQHHIREASNKNDSIRGSDKWIHQRANQNHKSVGYETTNKQTIKTRHHREESPKCSRYEREHFKLEYQMPTQPTIPELPQILPEEIDIKPTSKDYNQAQMQLFVNRKIKENLLKHQHFKANDKLRKLQQQKQIQQRLAQLQLKAKEIAAKSNENIDESRNQKPKAAWGYTAKPPEVEIKKCCHKVPIKPKTDAGKQVDPKIVKTNIKSRKELIKEQYKEMRGLTDKEDEIKNCQFHEIQKDSSKIAEIDKKIQKNAQRVLEAKALEKKKQQQEERLIKAKLKGLALQAKKKLNISKKQDIKDRPSFNYDATRQKVDYDFLSQKQDKEQLNEKNRKEQQSQVQIGHSKGIQKISNKSSSNNKKPSKSKGKDKIYYEAVEPNEGQVNQRGPFFVGDIPIQPDQTKQVFSIGKNQTKPSNEKKNTKFRKQVQEHIQNKMHKKAEVQVKNSHEEKFREKVQKKKNEFIKQYSEKKFPATGPGITDAAQLNKDIKKAAKKSK